ncbi:MFS transporter [Corynebacterium macginleyi]|uniref:MFS transporter n=2 Tax=Corynebacterium macginleyi TaxID=38290 RepID=A0ABS1Y8W6_9CORY|nr:MFS transporter [Corynebacterium macginleyi]MBK4144776.1 MFS transporter [Corynebacterium macginleyi]MBK4151021.1 MFS transporter [Corynebacterium macginleyi]MBK4152844.1 MFS transporter [Corynebacterium macginleyi]MBK4160798.1 MFS transporter [Corynebacterium macginleyi]MBK4162551.1 MFS transporter [Corynebacterium macginleyi]
MKRLEKYFISSNALDALAGSTATLITQIIVVNQLGFTGTHLGILSSLSIILYLVSAVPIGRVVDTLPPVTVLVAALAVKASVLITFAWLYVCDGLSFWTVLVLQVLQSVVGIFIDTSQIITATSIQSLLGDSKLVPRLESTDKAIGILAPAVVAFIAAKEFYKGGYIGVAALALCALVMIAFPVKKLIRQSSGSEIASSPNESKKTAWAKEKRSLLTGFRLIVHDKESLIPVLLIAAGNFGLAFIDSPKTLFLLREMSMSPSEFSNLKIIEAITGLLASLLSVRIIDKFKFAELVTTATLGQVLAALAFLSVVILDAPTFTFTAISNALWSASAVLINVSAMNFFVSQIPEGKIGIGLSSMRTAVMLVVPLGALLGGYCIDHAGYAFSIFSWVAITITTFLIGTILFLKRRPI